MTNLASEVLQALAGKTLATAESCTGGMIGAALTAIPGSSSVYKGGVISYCDAVKHSLLNVPQELLQTCGAVSQGVAQAMAQGARAALDTDYAVSVTGIAGPGGDGSGKVVGTVYIGCVDENGCIVKNFCFSGDRDAVRLQAAREALKTVLKIAQKST